MAVLVSDGRSSRKSVMGEFSSSTFYDDCVVLFKKKKKKTIPIWFVVSITIYPLVYTHTFIFF